MKIRTCLFILAVLVISTTAYSQVYKYRDAEGNTHFTDDLSRVPADQRPLQEATAPEQNEIEDQAAVPEAEGVEEEAAEETESPYAIATDEEPEEALPPDTDDWLAKEQLELREEYKSILAEKEAIEKLNQQKTEVNVVNQRIIKNNDRIQAYQARLAIYNEKVKKYNQFLVEQQAQPQ